MSTGFSGGPDDFDICGICGTKYMAPASTEPSLLRMRFLGREGFEECCGALLDRVYRETGERFFEAYLAEFAANPTDPSFGSVLYILQERLAEAQKALRKASRETARAEARVKKLREKR